MQLHENPVSSNEEVLECRKLQICLYSIISFVKLKLFTMNVVVCLNIVLLILARVSDSFAFNHSMESYLNSRLNYTNRLLKSSLAKDDVYSAGVEFKSEITTEIPNIYSTAIIFSLFNSSYVLLGIKLYHLFPVGDNFQLQFQSEFANQDNAIAFVQSTEYKNVGIVLMAFQNGHSRIYGIANDTKEWFFIHSIHDAATPIDALFFHNNFNLYLTIASNKANSLAFSKVYKWMGTHFDEIDSILTEGTISLISFSSGGSEMIIFEQKTATRNYTKTVVYEFNQDKLRKKQLIINVNVRHMITYVYKEKRFVMLFGETATNSLYLWDGSELVSWSAITTCNGIEKLFVMNGASGSLVFITQKDQLFVYRPSVTEVTLVKSVKYRRAYLAILDLYVVSYHDIFVVVIVGVKANNKFDFIEIPFSLYFFKDENQTEERNVLLQCFRNMEKMLKDIKYDVNDLSDESKTIIQKNEPLEFRGQLQVGASNFHTPPLVGLEQTVSNFDQKMFELNNNILGLSTRLDNLILNADSLFTKTSDTINGKMIIRGSLFARNFVTNNVNVRKLNNVEWLPDKWLSYTKRQTISGHVVTKSLIADNLNFPHKNGTLANLLLSDGVQRISGNCHVDFFATHNLRTERINDIRLRDVFMQSQSNRIDGKKSFDSIFVRNLNATNFNNQSIADMQSQLSNRQINNIHISDLQVEKIDNIDWISFKDSVFRIGINQRIIGNVTLPTMKTNNLFAKQINNIDGGDFLTTTTNQRVSSLLQLTYVNAKNVIANRVNEIDFSNVATIDHNEIKGPVTIDDLSITKTLFINDLNKEGDHIIGTDELDFLQIYNGTVKILGDLRVKAISLSPSTSLIINSLINETVDDFWSKSKNQKIPVHFEALNGLNASHLISQNLNGVPINKYFLNNLDDQLPVSVVFENITISGDIIVNPNLAHNPDLIKLKEESVKTTGEFTLTGQKMFQGRLGVGNLETNFIDDIAIESILTTRNLNEITDQITFEIVEVQGNLLAKSISTPFLNNVNLSDIREHTVYVDRPNSFESFDFNTMSANSLNTNFINNNQFKDYTSFLNNIYTSDSISSLLVEGNVFLSNVYGVATINSNNISYLLNRMNTQNGNVQQNVRFTGKVYVDNLFATIINGIDLQKLTQRILYKQWTQNLTAPYSFDKIITKNLVTAQINNYTVDSMISTDEEEPQVLRANLRLFNAQFESLNSKGLICDIHKAAMNLKSPSINHWQNVYVINNVTMMGEELDLYRIINNVVTTNRNNVIKAKVEFKNHILAKDIRLEKTINQIDLSNLVNDAVLRSEEEDQIITGRKIFGNLSISEAYVKGNADLPKINELIMADLNNSIVRKNFSDNLFIKGHKTLFAGLQTKHLITKNISGIMPDDLVSLANLKTVPQAHFYNLDVDGDFNINFVNNHNISHIMANRILLVSSKEQVLSGVYYFEDALIIGNSSISKINNIDVEDIVFDINTQNINSVKYFTENVTFMGNLNADTLNRYELGNIFENAVMYNSNVTLQNAKFLAPVRVHGSIIVENINHMPITELQQLHSTTPHIKMNNVQRILKQIERSVGYSFQLIPNMPERYLYVEGNAEFQLSVPNIVNAHLVQAKENVMLNLLGSTSGSFCGLPDHCQCPVQRTMQITSHLSVHTLTETGSERIFSYDDDDESIHLFSHGVSINSECRLPNSTRNREYSSIVWTLHEQTNQTGGSYNYYSEYLRGYISGVDYFSFNNITYAIVSRYYDPINDTHSTSGIVLKFTRQSNRIDFIQELATKGAWTTHLFHTAQGIVLIIGSRGNARTLHEPTGFDIYRFNIREEKFLLLRSVFGSDSKMSVGVTLGADSLIILAQSHYPLQVLKYHPNYDNYYFYQNLFFDAAVSSLSVFYAEEFGISDAYLCVVNENGAFFIYTFRYLQGWTLVFNGEIDGLSALVPFVLNTKTYLFAPSPKTSTLLHIAKQGRL